MSDSSPPPEVCFTSSPILSTLLQAAKPHVGLDLGELGALQALAEKPSTDRLEVQRFWRLSKITANAVARYLRDAAKAPHLAEALQFEALSFGAVSRTTTCIAFGPMVGECFRLAAEAKRSVPMQRLLCNCRDALRALQMAFSETQRPYAECVTFFVLAAVTVMDTRDERQRFLRDAMEELAALTATEVAA